MVKIIAAAGWAIAVGLVVFCYAQQSRLVAANEQIIAHKAEADSAQAAANEIAGRLAALEQRIKDLESASDAETAAGAATGRPEGFDPAALVKGIFGAAKDSVAESKTEEGPGSAFGRMFEGERGERMMESSADMTVNMQYGALWNDLKLSPEKEEALRAALSNHARAQMREGMKLMRGEAKPEELKAPTDDDLFAAAAEILDADELAQFEAYQAEIPERMLRQSMEMQLGMFAGGISEEGRAITVDALVGHLLPSTPEPGAMPDFEGMEAGYDAVLVQLESELSTEDFDRVRRFVEQQQAQFEMFSGMMERQSQGEAEAGSAQ